MTTNNMTTKLLLTTICIIFIGMIYSVFAKIIWFMPFQLFFEEFYLNNMTMQSNAPIFWLICVWFNLAGMQTAYLNLKNNIDFGGKEIFLSPLTPFILAKNALVQLSK